MICNFVNYNTEVLNKVYLISEILLSLISSIGIIFTLIYAIRQYESEKRHRKISKAADLAKLYAEELLDPMRLILNEFIEHRDLMKIIEKIDIDLVEDFSVEEAEEKLKISEEERKRYACLIRQQIYDEQSKYNEQTLKLVIQDTLNRIEYLCTYFNSGIAEDMTVYCSLHQTFLKLMKYAYIYIVDTNKDDMEKYYMNIIKTFNLWSKIYKEQKKNVKLEKNKLRNKYSAEKKKYKKGILKKIEPPSID